MGFEPRAWIDMVSDSRPLCLTSSQPGPEQSHISLRNKPYPRFSVSPIMVLVNEDPTLQSTSPPGLSEEHQVEMVDTHLLLDIKHTEDLDNDTKSGPLFGNEQVEKNKIQPSSSKPSSEDFQAWLNAKSKMLSSVQDIDGEREQKSTARSTPKTIQIRIRDALAAMHNNTAFAYAHNERPVKPKSLKPRPPRAPPPRSSDSVKGWALDSLTESWTQFAQPALKVLNPEVLETRASKEERVSEGREMVGQYVKPLELAKAKSGTEKMLYSSSGTPVEGFRSREENDLLERISDMDETEQLKSPATPFPPKKRVALPQQFSSSDRQRSSLSPIAPDFAPLARDVPIVPHDMLQPPILFSRGRTTESSIVLIPELTFQPVVRMVPIVAVPSAIQPILTYPPMSQYASAEDWKVININHGSLLEEMSGDAGDVPMPAVTKRHANGNNQLVSAQNNERLPKFEKGLQASKGAGEITSIVPSFSKLQCETQAKQDTSVASVRLIEHEGVQVTSSPINLHGSTSIRGDLDSMWPMLASPYEKRPSDENKVFGNSVLSDDIQNLDASLVSMSVPTSFLNRSFDDHAKHSGTAMTERLLMTNATSDDLDDLLGDSISSTNLSMSWSPLTPATGTVHSFSIEGQADDDSDSIWQPLQPAPAARLMRATPAIEPSKGAAPTSTTTPFPTSNATSIPTPLSTPTKTPTPEPTAVQMAITTEPDSHTMIKPVIAAQSGRPRAVSGRDTSDGEIRSAANFQKILIGSAKAERLTTLRDVWKTMPRLYEATGQPKKPEEVERALLSLLRNAKQKVSDAAVLVKGIHPRRVVDEKSLDAFEEAEHEYAALLTELRSVYREGVPAKLVKEFLWYPLGSWPTTV